MSEDLVVEEHGFVVHCFRNTPHNHFSLARYLTPGLRTWYWFVDISGFQEEAEYCAV